MKGLLLILTIDVQGDRLEGELIAWAPEFESFGIEYKQWFGDPLQKEVWLELDEYSKGSWIHESGVSLKISAVGIDTGYLPEAVENFIEPRQARRFFALRGAKPDDAPLFRLFTHSKKQERKVPRFYVGTHVAKDMLITWMKNEKKGPGYMHFPLHYDFEYFKQLCSEIAIIVRDKYGKVRRKWVPRPGHKRNEPFDIRNYSLAVLQILNPNWKKLEARIMKMAEEFKDEELKKNEEKKKQGKKKTVRKKSFVNDW